MMRSIIKTGSVAVFFVAVLANAIHNLSFPRSDAATMQANYPIAEHVSIRLNEDGDEFAKRYTKNIGVNKQPAGLNFYKIDVDGRKKILTVVFEHGKHSFEIENVLYVRGTQDMERKEGMESFDLGAGLTTADEIMHDDARKTVMALLKRIRQAGWRVEIGRGTARLRGKQALEAYVKNNDPLWLDGEYEPTMQEWMQLDNMSGWRFYADNAFLTITFMRDRKKLDPTKPGAYYLSIDVESAELNYRSQIEEKDRPNWRRFWPIEEAKLQQLRQEAEAKARAAGLFIDTNYQDPPLPPVPPSSVQH